MRSSSRFADLTEDGHLQPSGIFQRSKVRASRGIQLHFQVCTIRTLQEYQSPTNRPPPGSLMETLVSQVPEGTLTQLLASQHLAAFSYRVYFGLTLCVAFPSLPGSGRPKRAARATVWWPSENSACPEEDAPAALTPPDARSLGPGLRSRRRREDARARAGEARHPPRRPRRRQPRSLAPPPPEAGPARASPPHRGCPPSACAPRCRACRPHSPHPLRELVTSCPRPISVRGQSVAPCRSRRLLCFPLPTLSTAVAPAVRGGGGREKNGTDFNKVSRSICYPPGPRWGTRAAPRPSPKPGGPLQVERR